jgi:S-formylglutathione hydrolase FrmB
MALLECCFRSEVLRSDVGVSVILPDKTDVPVSTLYLLHGLSDDHTAWRRRTAIERYVEGLPLAVVMPEVGRSFYQNMAYGGPYWTYLSEELPEMIQRFFKLPQERERTFAAGLSMGGYGAFRLALTFPERFAAAASLSGALDVATSVEKNLLKEGPSGERLWVNIFGLDPSVRGSDSDLLHLAGKLTQSDRPRPRLYQACGTEDFVYDQNEAFLRQARSVGLQVEYEEEPADHVWPYWDRQVQKVVGWLPIQNLKSKI